jgi:bleomycin hydrolase
MKRPSKLKIAFVAQLALILSASSLFAAEGALEPDTIDKIRSAFKMDSHTRAMYNSITNNDISSLALNRDVLRRHNEIFSHKIETKGITNQNKSGRCWLFAGLNILRPIIIEKHNLESFEFSQNYLAFWDKLEKANCFLEHIIEFRDPGILGQARKGQLLS